MLGLSRVAIRKWLACTHSLENNLRICLTPVPKMKCWDGAVKNLLNSGFHRNSEPRLPPLLGDDANTRSATAPDFYEPSSLPTGNTSKRACLPRSSE
jgi:hypothetical protein